MRYTFTVTGTTRSDIDTAADAEAARFFGGTYVIESIEVTPLALTVAGEVVHCEATVVAISSRPVP